MANNTTPAKVSYTKYAYTNPYLNEFLGYTVVYAESMEKLYRMAISKKEIYWPMHREYARTHKTEKSRQKEPFGEWMRYQLNYYTDEPLGGFEGELGYDVCSVPAVKDVLMYVRVREKD